MLMEQRIYTEGFFDRTNNNLYKLQVVKDIDGNIDQLMKTDAKSYAIHVSPSEKKQLAMGTTEQEQAEAMKRYIREVFIPTYAQNFNKDLSASDIKFYGKIHFDRNRSDNELNMHCHLIVSRKDQSNKKKLSPLTNHRNTKKGAIKGGFDRTKLFQQAEQGFDKLFNFNRPLTETFNYCNTMKNGSIVAQLEMQERAIKQKTPKQGVKEDVGTNICANEQPFEHSNDHSASRSNKQENNLSNKIENKQNPNPNNSNEEQPQKKQIKRGKGLGR